MDGSQSMVDYVALLLANMLIALVVLACFLWRGLDRPDSRDWAPVFGISGLVATVAGFAMALTWPIPKPFSSIYGEMSVLFGVLFGGAAVALGAGWRLLPLGCYACVAGLVAIVVGVRFVLLSLTPLPLLPGAGFVLTGLAGVGSPLVLHRPNSRGLRGLGIAVVLAAAGIWALTCLQAYWLHMKPS